MRFSIRSLYFFHRCLNCKIYWIDRIGLLEERIEEKNQREYYSLAKSLIFISAAVYDFTWNNVGS